MGVAGLIDPINQIVKTYDGPSFLENAPMHAPQ